MSRDKVDVYISSVGGLATVSMKSDKGFGIPPSLDGSKALKLVR